ncbi:MAG: hypothetical protein P4L82_21915 [Ancalomicrobiaceae bacterium]|nr:hypothetical protein [Ancalomicrobiaceae bacterium]
MSLKPSQAIQVVWFLTANDDIKADRVFELMFEGEPENVQKNRTPNPVNPFLSTASGTIDALKLDASVQVQVGRVDLVISPHFAEDDFSAAQVVLFDTEKVLRILEAAYEQLGSTMKSAFRLAIVANTIDQADSYLEALQKACEIVGITQYGPDVSDFMFQLNRRKGFDGNLTVNRLMRFSIVEIKNVTISLNAIMPPTFVTYPSALTNAFGVMTTYDLNTVPDGQIIEPSKQTAVLKVLTSELLSLASIGSPKALEG